MDIGWLAPRSRECYSEAIISIAGGGGGGGGGAGGRRRSRATRVEKTSWAVSSAEETRATRGPMT